MVKKQEDYIRSDIKKRKQMDSESGSVVGGIKISKEQNIGTEKSINTGGGAFIGGNVNTGGGDFVGRDKIVSSDHNVIGSTMAQKHDFILQVFDEINRHPNLDPLDKEDLIIEIKELQKEDDKGNDADEARISRHLRNIKRMAPDIFEVVLDIIGNPLADFGIVAKKVAEKMKVDSG